MTQSDKESILIVDNDFHNLKLLCTYFMGEGYMVRIAKSDEQAEISVEASLPDLLIIDADLPKRGGLELCKKLKSHFRTWSTPIIFTSFEDDPATTMQAYELGIVDYFQKPLRIEEVKARIHIQLQLVRQVRELKEFNRIMLDREERVLELKSEINELSEQLGKPEPYPEVKEHDGDRDKP